MQKISDILAKHDVSKIGKYVTREYQEYGLRLAHYLNDHEHKSLYIRLAKHTPRNLLEQAMAEIKDASKVRSRARLFMWKLKQLRKG